MTLPFELSDRQKAILERLERTSRVHVSELAQEHQVSDVTIRKDLQTLEEQSLLKRVHGGAVAARRTKYNLSIGDKIGRLTAGKTRIAQAALALVHDGDTLIIDAGSTTLALARLLPGRKRGLTVVTNALPIIAELSNRSSFELILLGGMVRSHSLAMIGPLTVANLRRLHADIAFVGATGADVRRGLSTPNFIEAETKAAMVAAASECVALVDHGKIGQASLAPFASWEECRTLVTDAPVPEELVEQLIAVEVTVVVADELPVDVEVI